MVAQVSGVSLESCVIRAKGLNSMDINEVGETKLLLILDIFGS